MCTVIQYRATSKVNERIRVVFKCTLCSDWPSKMAIGLNNSTLVSISYPSLENHKDSHSIKDFFRLNPHEHENMDIDAIPKHHKVDFLREYRTFSLVARIQMKTRIRKMFKQQKESNMVLRTNSNNWWSKIFLI